MANLAAFSPLLLLALADLIICSVFLKDFPEQCGAFRDNDKSLTPEMAQQMMIMEVEARKRSVWKRLKIWGCKDWWLMGIPNSLLLSCAMAFMAWSRLSPCSGPIIRASVTPCFCKDIYILTIYLI